MGLEIFSTTDELGIDRALVTLYTDNHDPEICEGLMTMLNVPAVENFLRDIRALDNGHLYDQFIEALFEDRYCFRCTDDIALMQRTEKSLPQLIGLIKTADASTEHSHIKKQYASEMLSRYKKDLMHEDAGAMIFGSVLYGDAEPESDIDLLLYGAKRTDQAEKLLNCVRKDMMTDTTDIHIDITYPLWLDRLYGNLGTILNRRPRNLVHYMTVDQGNSVTRPQWHWLDLLLGRQLYQPSEKAMSVIISTKERILQSARQDAIMDFAMSYCIASNMLDRTKRLECNLV